MEKLPFERIDFRPARAPHIVMGLVFGTLWVILAIGVGAYVARLLREPAWRERLDDIIPAILFVVAVGTFIAHAVFWPRRLRFTDEGVHQFFLVRWRFRRWRDVRRAWLERIRSASYITLHFGWWRFVLIPIGDYRLQRRLYDEIARRIPVPIKGHGVQVLLNDKAD